jgi:DNA-binding transcriptional ArsR family regulator
LIDHDNLEAFADPVDYDRRDSSDTGVAFYASLARETGGTRVSQTTARGVDYRERLGAGPATVGDATAGFGVSKPAITKHVKVLEETGVVTRAVEGRTHVLSLELDVLREVAEWMDRQRAVWGRFMDVVDEYLKEEGAK